jgi:hypothetical protein
MQLHTARIVPLLAAVLLLAGCGTIEKDKRVSALEAALYRYGEAIRWGYYDSAFALVHPDRRTALPPGLENIRVTGYEVVQPPAQTGGDTAAQMVRIDYVREDVQRVRTLTDRQQWRYEPATKSWWLYSGVPAFE